MKYPETIIIERMYAGKYIDGNIGHEIINTFKTDNDENYIYISPNGTINSNYQNTKYVLLVRLINQHTFEIIGYAGDLELLLSKESFKFKQKDSGIIESEKQLEIIENNSIKYGGVKINDLLAEQSNAVFVTFKAKNVKRAKKRIFIVDSMDLADDNHIYLPNIKFSKTSLKMYVDNNKNKEAYVKIFELISDKKVWEDKNTLTKIDIDKPLDKNFGILDIIKKDYDELTYSNWLAYYLNNDLDLLKDFCSSVLHIDIDLKSVKVLREYHNIDIWIEDSNHIIVIENKIKSGINGERHDLEGKSVQSQLSDYVKTANKEAHNRKIHYFLLLPNYSYKNEDLKKYSEYDKYILIRYSDLLDFFQKCNCDLEFYEEFIKAIKKHSTEYRKDLYEIMEDRFVRTIKMKREYYHKNSIC